MITPLLRALTVAALALLAALPALDRARAIEIDVTEGTLDPLPIAIAGFQGDLDLAAPVVEVIENNLRRSGLFRPLDRASFLQNDATVSASPRFADWRAIGAQALAVGSVARQADGQVRAEFRLWDPVSQTQLAGQQFFTTPDNWRRIAHIISDAIYAQMTGESGYFDTRIVFIDESGPKDA
ncbi:MAG: Tol-Pal system protein TolB, partial [Pseudomonadota bacterium]